MKYMQFFLSVIIPSVFLVLFFYYKIDQNYFFNQDKGLSIVCTTGMIADIVKNITKDSAQVYGLMGAGIDPHLYRARAGDMQKLMNADIIFYNGLHLEGKMSEIFESLQNTKKICAVSNGVAQENLRSAGYEGVYDPHIWHDVELWIQVVQYVSAFLQEHDSANKNLYARNANEYSVQLEKLNNEIKDLIADIPEEKRILVTAHDAFGYFGARYGIEVIGLQGISTDADVGVKDIQRVVERIIEKNVPAIFVESSIPQRTVQAVQDAVAAQGKHVAIGKELYSDALGDGNARTYSGMIRHNVLVIHAALKV